MSGLHGSDDKSNNDVIPNGGTYGDADTRLLAWAAPDSSVDQPSVAVSTLAEGTVSSSGHGADQRDKRTVVPPVRLRPMTVTEILDGSFAVIRTRPRTVILIAAAILVPVQMLAAYTSRRGLAGLGGMFGQANVFMPFEASSNGIATFELFLAIAAMLAGPLALFFLGGALTYLVTQWYVGGDPSTGEALTVVFRRTWSILAAWALLLIAKFIGAIACYLGLIFIVPLFSLTAPAMIAENLGPIASARRSWQLISRRLWRNIGVIALVTLVEYALHQALSLMPMAIALSLPSPINWIVLGVAGSLVSMVTSSALVSGSVLLYLDMRIRTEGLDLEIAAVDAF